MQEVVTGRLWIGNAGDARNAAAVLAAGIRAVVDLAMEQPPIAPRAKSSIAAFR